MIAVDDPSLVRCTLAPYSAHQRGALGRFASEGPPGHPGFASDAKWAQQAIFTGRERGALVVLSGNAQGCSASGFGIVAGALGHGMRVGIVQFRPSAEPSGEERFFRTQPRVRYHLASLSSAREGVREGETPPEAWRAAGDMLLDSSIDLVLLDAPPLARDATPPLSEWLARLRGRPAMQHVVVTVDQAPPELVAIADIATEIRDLKSRDTLS